MLCLNVSKTETSVNTIIVESGAWNEAANFLSRKETCTGKPIATLLGGLTAVI